MATGDLTTFANAQAWLGLTDDDGTVLRLISAVSTQIQQFISYDIASKSYTRTFNGVGSNRQMLPDMPVTAVASVLIDGVSIAAATATSIGFLFDAKCVYLRGCIFSRGVQNVQIAYTAGYAETPADIEQACLEWLKVTHDHLDRAANVSRLRAGDTEIQYTGDTVQSNGRLLAPMPASVYALLQPYARVYPA